MSSTADRLHPSLLDRLTDDEPDRTSEASDSRSARRNQLKQGVLRDLVWLLNTVRPDQALFEGLDQARDSVLNFGLPALSGQSIASLDGRDMERAIHAAIIRFEPRIDPSSLSVQLLQAIDVTHHHQVGFEIRGRLWSHPHPVDLLLKTQLDVECGEFRLDADS
ncbi:type VI secretion system baseplate subunit TssE [Chitinimonas arctica]|uniref:Type VI secretion system baseplate subunit TssE n=1 Tax=Chitinimonas arctica TaxID=2594795 RepID=A0A516SH92_9NEIS|nr:type VI secretion system baseplate subunit TssE [Chitinimonas arctica]QDQ27502.1 type VI secretion system baseplate subunit TssE [Chitinimonas arctica]